MILKLVWALIVHFWPNHPQVFLYDIPSNIFLWPFLSCELDEMWKFFNPISKSFDLHLFDVVNKLHSNSHLEYRSRLEPSTDLTFLLKKTKHYKKALKWDILKKFFLQEETHLPSNKSPWQWPKLYTQSAPKNHASSEVVAFEAQFKNYYMWCKIQGPFLRFSNFYNLNHSINFESFSVMICISTKGRMHFWLHLSNCTSFGH